MVLGKNGNTLKEKMLECRNSWAVCLTSMEYIRAFIHHWVHPFEVFSIKKYIYRVMPPSPLSSLEHSVPPIRNSGPLAAHLPSLTQTRFPSVPSVSVGLCGAGSVVLLSHPSFPRRVCGPHLQILSSGLSRNAVHSLGLVVSNGCDFSGTHCWNETWGWSISGEEKSDAGPRGTGWGEDDATQGWLRQCRGPWAQPRLCETWARWQACLLEWFVPLQVIFLLTLGLHTPVK